VKSCKALEAMLFAAAIACASITNAIAAAPKPDEVLARLIETPAPTPSWAKAKTRHNIPVMSDLSAGMLGTLVVEQGISSVRYMVYLGSAEAQADFARIAYPPKEQSAGPMQERATTASRGPAMVCGQAYLSRRPPLLVATCAGRHPVQPLTIRAIEPPGAGAEARAQQHVEEAMRHVDSLLAASSPPPPEPGARLYRALRTLPMPRSKALAERLEGLAIVEEEVRDISKADGVFGRMSVQGNGVTVRYVVFGAGGHMKAWYDRAVAAPFDGYQLVKSSDLTETGKDRSLRDPFASRLWASTSGSVMCDVIALHRALPLGLRVVLPIPKATVKRDPSKPGTYSVHADMFDEASCMWMATELGSWASERGAR
jgi:hypothetical protein